MEQLEIFPVRRGIPEAGPVRRSAPVIMLRANMTGTEMLVVITVRT